MKRFKKEFSWLLVAALVVSSLVIGFGNIPSSAQTQAVGQMGTYQFRVKTAGQDCGGTGTANDLTITINYSDGTSQSANRIAGESSPNYFEAGNTDTIQLSPALPAKPISSISFDSHGSDRWKVDWTALDYLEGSNWRQIATTGAFDYSGGVRTMTYPSDYSLNTSSLNKTLTFNANGGSGGTSIYSISGATLPSSNIPTVTRTGYTFAGWSPAAPTTGPAADTTYTAQWTANTYTVTFNANGGSTPSPTSKTVTFASTYGTLATTSREGYTFTGWYTATSGGTKIETTTAVTTASNHTLYAQWSINSYTITFDANGGTGGWSQSLQYGATLTPPTVTRTGHTFSSWSPTPPATVPASNATYTAQWSINSYTITFDSNGGSAVSPITQNFGTTVTPPANPTRTGYTFGSWSPAVPSTMPATNTTCTAQWTANTYYVAFNNNGGTGSMSSQTYTYGTAQNLTSNTFTREGHTFTGWNTQANGSGNAYTNGQSVSNLTSTNGATVTLYAQWSINNYTITFDANGGTGGWSQSMQYGATLTPPTVTRTGYTFAGWSPTPPATVPGSNATYTAQWTINQYTVSFNSNGGTAVSPITQNYNTTVVQPTAPTKTGNTFAGWFSDVGLTNAVSWPYTLTGNVTFYAKWTVNSYTITFNSDGGTAVSPITQAYGSSVTAPANPTKTGYTFTGWSPELPSTMPAGNMTCTAQWVINQYTVSFESNGGTAVSPITQNYNTSVSQPTAPTKTGNTFAGWFSDVGLTNAVSWPYTLGAQNVTFYAKWTVNAYNVIFNANGGSGTMSNQAINYGASAALTANAFSRTGYSFAGWNTIANGSGTAYANQATYGPMGAADVTLYAQWTINSYTITFDANGGTGGWSQSMQYGATLTAPTVTRTGYAFTGWSPSVPGTVPASNATYTAQWTALAVYTITFAAGSNGLIDGQAQVQDEYYEGEDIVVPRPRGNHGWAFAGWDVTPPATAGASATYTAQWAKIEVTLTKNGSEFTVNIAGWQADYNYQIWSYQRITSDAFLNDTSDVQNNQWILSMAYAPGSTGDLQLNGSINYTIDDFTSPDENYTVAVRIADENGNYVQEIRDSYTPEDVQMPVITRVLVDGAFSKGPEIKAIGEDSSVLIKVIANLPDLTYTATVLETMQTLTVSNTNEFVWDTSILEPRTLTVRVTVSNETDEVSREIVFRFYEPESSVTFARIESLTVNDLAGVSLPTTTNILTDFSGGNMRYTVQEPGRTPIFTSGESATMGTINYTVEQYGRYLVTAVVNRPGMAVSTSSYDDGIMKYLSVKRSAGTSSMTLDANVNLSNPINKGTAVEFEASASIAGIGSTPVEYSFWRYDAKGYILVKDWSGDNTLDWTPAKVGIYTIEARAKGEDAGSYEVLKSVRVTVTDPADEIAQGVAITINEAYLNANAKVREPIVIRAQATSTNGDDLLYRFIITDEFDGMMTRTLQNYSADQEYVWTPRKAGDYRITVQVKNRVSYGYSDKTESFLITVD